MTMNSNTFILGQLDPDLVSHMASSRRGLFARSALALGAMASVPLVLAAASKEVFAKGLPRQIVER